MRLLSLALMAALAAPAARVSAAEPILRVGTVHVCAARGDLSRPPASVEHCSARAVESVDPQGRTLWILADVTVPSSLVGSRRPMAVLMQSMASTVIFWDDKRIGESGRVSDSAEHEQPGQFVHIVPLRADELAPGVHRLAVLMSSHRGLIRVNMPVHVLAIAPADLIRDGVGSSARFVLVALGALLLAAVYFGAISTLAPSRTSRPGDATMLAAMILGALIQCAAELWRTFVPISYVAQQWRLVIILLAATGLGAALVTYVARRFSPSSLRPFLSGYGVVTALVWLLPGFDLRTLCVLGAGGAFAVLATFSAARRGEPGARAITAVLLLLIGVGTLEAGAFLDRELFVGLTMLVLVLLIDHIGHIRRIEASSQLAQQQVERLENELLRRRLTPHWLLNMLNAVTAWIEEEPTTAVRMVGLLGDEFHRLAHPLDRPLIPVRDELEACDRLLSLMSLRSGRTFTLDASGVTPNTQLPPGVLHTLVENALTHGRYRRDATFTVREHLEHGHAVLTFEAPPAEANDAPSGSVPGAGDPIIVEGFGLTYVRERLRTAYGEANSLSYGRTKDGRWRTMLRLGVAAS